MKKILIILILAGTLAIAAFAVIRFAPKSFETAVSKCGLEGRFNLEVNEDILSYKPQKSETDAFENIECLMKYLEFKDLDRKAVHNIYLQFMRGDGGDWHYFIAGDIKLFVHGKLFDDYLEASFTRPWS